MANYTDKDTVKAEIKYTPTDFDELLTNKIIPAISQMIDRKCNRPDGFVASDTATVRLYSGSGEGVQRIDEAAAITTVAVKASPTDAAYVTWGSDDWLAFSGDPNYPDFNHTPYTGIMAAAGSSGVFTSGWLTDEPSWTGMRTLSRINRRRGAPPTVQVTAKWGYALTTPPVIEQACVIECARLFKQAQSNFADTLASVTLGQLIQIAKLHPTTIAMLEGGRFVRPAIG